MSDDLSTRLAPEHLKMLREGSAISDEVIVARGYRTITQNQTGELKLLGFVAAKQRRPGLLIPLHTTSGGIGMYILRPDQPRKMADKRGKVRTLRYEQPSGVGTRLDCPPTCQPMLADPAIPLWITEGQKKADSLVSHGLCAVALLGVWNWKGVNALGGATFANDWDYIALVGREMHIVFDSDVMVKLSVRAALDRLIEHLRRKKADVTAVYLPHDDNGKVGVDDFFAQGHAVSELQALIDAPAPVIRAAPPSFGNELLNVDANEQDLSLVTAQAWQAIAQVNAAHPYLFVYGGIPSRMDTEDGLPTLHELTPDRLRHESARAANWYTAHDDHGDAYYEKAKPPVDVIHDMLASREIPLPALARIVEAPVFAPDGILQTEPGYHPASRTFYAPCGCTEIPLVNDDPTTDEVNAARSLIFDDLLAEFPFVEDADRANAMGMMLLPFARDLISGPTPNHLVEAPIAGSGKGLLSDVLLYPAVGSRVALMAEARDDDEWRKRITAALREGRSAILIDNVVRVLNSGVLASALTALEWTDRVLGVSEIISLPVRCVWATTANNPTMSTEIARRCIRIRLDAKVDRPWQRNGFFHADLRGWARAHRGQLIWAALTLIRHWLISGQPSAHVRPLGSYESWSSTIGGILQQAGIEGFLRNLDSLYADADIEGATWREFVAQWWSSHQDGKVGVAELFAIADELEGMNMGKGEERARKTAFGIALKKRRDQVIDHYRIAFVGTLHRVSQWKLVDVSYRLPLPNMVREEIVV